MSDDLVDSIDMAVNNFASYGFNTAWNQPAPLTPESFRKAVEAMDKEAEEYPLGRPHECAVHPDILKGKAVQCGDCGMWLKIIDGQIHHSFDLPSARASV